MIRSLVSLRLVALASGALAFASGASAQTTYTNSTPLTITDNAAASVYPSTIAVAGETLPAGKVTVKLIGLTHTNPDDLDILLVSPQGVKLLLMSDCGGTTDVSNFTITLDDAAANALPDSGSLTDNATYRPRNVGGGDSIPAPAPAGPYLTSLSNVRGMDANGVWSLYIVDDNSGNSGSLSGWSITVTPSVCVTNTNNSGAGSLRQAILDANGAPGRDYICFNIPGAGPHIISPTTELPAIDSETVIDGFTQPGSDCSVWPPTIKIVLDGQNGAGDGLTFTNDADGSAVRGLNIRRFADNGIRLDGADGMVIQCNFIGTDVTGAAAMANGRNGIYLGERSDGNRIGGVLLENLTDLDNGSGVTPVGRNVISGNLLNGISLYGADDNTILTNLIGVDATGGAALGNGANGILVDGPSDNDSTDNRIGTNGDGEFDFEEGNVISANTDRGIALTEHSRRTTITGNLIGLSLNGLVDLGNGKEGIQVTDSADNRIGVGDPAVYYAEPNYISGNGRDGVRFSGSGARNNTVAGNIIGLNKAGNDAGNDMDGVQLAPDAEFNTIGSDNDGSIDEYEGNTIAFNDGDGISAQSSSPGGLGIADGNIFSRNRIYSNGGLGIDLGPDGVTANDSMDPDNGPNELKNFPVITSVSATGTIVGSLNSTPNRVYRIEFFASASPDPSTYGEGSEFLGSVEVTTNGSGDAKIHASVTPVVGKPYITATSTDLRAAGFGLNDHNPQPDPDFSRGTSEFSGVVEQQGGGPNPDPDDLSAVTCEDNCVVITLTAQNAAGLDFVVTTLPTIGKLYQFSGGPGAQITTVPTTVTDSLHRVVFCPDENENGNDYATFEFKVSNNLALFGPGTVTVDVTPVNDRPSFGVMKNPDNPIVFMENGGTQCKEGFIINFGGGGDEAEDLGQSISGYVITEISDPDGVLAVPFTVSLDGDLCVTPAPGKCGTVTFRIAVIDDGGVGPCTDNDPSVPGIDTSFSIPVSFTVKCVNDPPEAICQDRTFDLSHSCDTFTASQLAQLINNGSNDPEDGLNVTLAVCFYGTDQPIPDFYEFPLGQTKVTLKVTDHGAPDMDDGETSEPLTSTCSATITILGKDCNENGLADTCDIALGRSVDCDHDWVPDECQCLWDNGQPVRVFPTAAVFQQNGQASHLGGGIPDGAKVADDFELCNGYIHKINKFRGYMLTNTLPFLRKAKLEFYEDCNGSPAETPFARYLNGVIVNTVWNAAPGYDLVCWEFDLCEEHLWLDGGKTYWVSLMGLSDNNTQDISFWLQTESGEDGHYTLGSTPRKALGNPGSGANHQFTFGPWSPLEDCCIGCVNMAFGMTGTSCKLYWDNGGPELAAPGAGGSPSGANGFQTARSVDNFVTKPCQDIEVCAIEAYVWNNCVPPTAFIEVYEDSPCSLNYDFDPPVAQRVGPEQDPIFRAERNDAWSVMPTNKTVVIDGVTYHGYRLLFTGLKLTLQPGRNYWISAGVNGTGSFAQRAFFAYADDCPDPTCNIKISPGQSRRETPAPRTPWVEGTHDFAFRIFVSTPAEEVMNKDSYAVELPPGCVADLDHDGDSDVTDLFGFLDFWFAGCP